MKRMIFGMVLLGLLGLADPANAGLYYGQPLNPPGSPLGSGPDPTFIFTFASNDGTIGAFGTLNATSNGNGTFTATTGSVTVIGAPASGIGSLFPNPTPPATVISPSGFFTYDDQLLPGQNPLITNGGLLFIIAGGIELNIFSNGPGPGTYQLYENNGFNVFGNFALTQVNVVPEPSSLILTGLGGVVGLGGICVRRRKAAALA